MKEIIFLNTNVQRWHKFESLLTNPMQTKPDKLADLFIQLTDDLSYSRTFYPKSETTRYLNSLTSKAHLLIYRNKRDRANRLRTFWQFEFPLLFYQNRKNFYYSLIVFIIAVLIGIISTLNDDTFARLILGNAYVNMTISNIEKNDPMAIYKDAEQMNMFLGITVNNIAVAFYTFIYGIFFSIGTVWQLFRNGVMLGCFESFFFQRGLLYQSILSIWIHGTLEIFSIIGAGAAGLMVGNSFLFPKTYSRFQSFVLNVRKAVKILIGFVPVFIVAAFLEGFVTRYTNAPQILRISIILLSLTFIIWYFFIYPKKILRNL